MSKQLFFFLLVLGMFSLKVNAAAKNTEKQIREVGAFHSIKVSSGIDLYLSQGDEEKLTVVADSDILDILATEVKDGVLKVYMKKKLYWHWNETKKVYVVFRNLDKLDVSSGADVESEDKLYVRDLNIEVSSGSDVALALEADRISVHVSSGADIELVGVTNILDASASSGSDLKAEGLKSKICKVSASSGADASVFVTDEIKGRASSGADIRYYGNPSCKEIDESSGGDVHGK